MSIPAPSWSVAPPQPGGVGPVVQAVIPAEPPEVQQQFGDAMWVKVFMTESENEAELHHLVTDDPAVPQDAIETETEWAILQNGPGGANNELANEHELAPGKKSVTRRYEFYRYTGAYDPESHEVLCGGGAHHGGSCSAPLAGELGNYLGAQMAALNLQAVGSPTATDTAVPTPTAMPIATPTTTPVSTLTATPVPTLTVTRLPTLTATPISTVSVTPIAHLCIGDCDGGGTVIVNELVMLVNVALGSASPSVCPAGISDGAVVDITMLVRAVNNALGGCPQA